MKFKERLGLVEKVYVGINLDRRLMRPAPGTMLVEIVDKSQNTMVMDTLEVDTPAPKGPFKVPSGAATFVKDGATGHAHQSFMYSLADPNPPVKLPDYMLDKIRIGASFARVWWSCEVP